MTAVWVHPDSKVAVEPTFVLEKQIGSRADIFVEYIGDYRQHAGPAHLLNSGAAYRLTDRPFRALPLSAAFAVASVWLGLSLAYADPSLPPSFAIMAVATAIFVASYAVSAPRAWRGRQVAA